MESKPRISRPEFLWKRGLRELRKGKRTSRQLAGPPVYAHAAHSMIAELRGRRLQIVTEMIIVSGYCGQPTRIARYELRPESFELADQLLAGRR